ncbi:MAG TPA: RNA 2',3'-cyclic phosphodiesterase [Longimicrobiaceae bacterium]|nr:RNA 2',3'-cyclic phosphodiesterase [Longimicrobiaceae bacterium]
MAASEERRGGGERLFLAVDLPEDARRALEVHLRESLAGRPLPGRAVAPRSWHLTLRFLGDTAPERRVGVVRALREADPGPAFTLGFGGLGAFPRPARASVLWLGVEEGAAPLRALAATAEEAARQAGFPAEARPFSPHLTLSRIRPPQDVRGVVERVPAFRERIPVEEVVLFRSHLGPGGARYEAVEHFPLRAP